MSQFPVEEEVGHPVGLLLHDLLRRDFCDLGVVDPQPLACRVKDVAGIMAARGRLPVVVGDRVELVCCPVVLVGVEELGREVEHQGVFDKFVQLLDSPDVVKHKPLHVEDEDWGQVLDKDVFRGLHFRFCLGTDKPVQLLRLSQVDNGVGNGINVLQLTYQNGGVSHNGTSGRGI